MDGSFRVFPMKGSMLGITEKKLLKIYVGKKRILSLKMGIMGIFKKIQQIYDFVLQFLHEYGTYRKKGVYHNKANGKCYKKTTKKKS